MTKTKNRIFMIILAFFAVLSMMLCLTACGKTKTDDETVVNDSADKIGAGYELSLIMEKVDAKSFLQEGKVVKYESEKYLYSDVSSIYEACQANDENGRQRKKNENNVERDWVRTDFIDDTEYSVLTHVTKTYVTPQITFQYNENDKRTDAMCKIDEVVLQDKIISVNTYEAGKDAPAKSVVNKAASTYDKQISNRTYYVYIKGFKFESGSWNYDTVYYYIKDNDTGKKISPTDTDYIVVKSSDKSTSISSELNAYIKKCVEFVPDAFYGLNKWKTEILTNLIEVNYNQESTWKTKELDEAPTVEASAQKIVSGDEVSYVLNGKYSDVHTSSQTSKTENSKDLTVTYTFKMGEKHLELIGTSVVYNAESKNADANTKDNINFKISPSDKFTIPDINETTGKANPAK